LTADEVLPGIRNVVPHLRHMAYKGIPARSSPLHIVLVMLLRLQSMNEFAVEKKLEHLRIEADNNEGEIDKNKPIRWGLQYATHDMT